MSAVLDSARVARLGEEQHLPCEAHASLPVWSMWRSCEAVNQRLNYLRALAEIGATLHGRRCIALAPTNAA